MREAPSQRNRTLCKARIPQIRLAEFGTRPVVSIVSVDQFQLPSRTEWAKVNIDTDCLQAIIHSYAQKVVGNPERMPGRVHRAAAETQPARPIPYVVSRPAKRLRYLHDYV